jgi:hypothetical protein
MVDFPDLFLLHLLSLTKDFRRGVDLLLQRPVMGDNQDAVAACAQLTAQGFIGSALVRSVVDAAITEDQDVGGAGR